MNLNKVDPELLPAVEQMQQIFGSTSLDLTDLATVRGTMAAMAEQAADGVPAIPHVENERKTIHDEALGIDVELETYSNTHVEGDRPAIIFIHGGGYVGGAANQAAPKLSQWSDRLGALIVSVEYRLAPEHPFPAALHDCFAALRWVAEFAENLQVDPNRIILVGESAGGGLAAGLALYARDQSDIKIAFQLLVYPMLDCNNVQAAGGKLEDTLVWSRDNNRMGWEAYLSNGVADEMLKYAVPSTAEDLSGLPPAFVPVGDLDLFQTENEQYVERLQSTPVEAEFKSYPGAFHGFASLAPEAAISQQFNQEIEDALRAACTP